MADDNNYKNFLLINAADCENCDDGLLLMTFPFHPESQWLMLEMLSDFCFSFAHFAQIQSLLCNYLPFFKTSVFCVIWFILHSVGGVVMLSGHPDPVYFWYGSSTTPIHIWRTFVGILSIVKCSIFHAVLFTANVKICQNVFLKNTFGTTFWCPFPVHFTGGR